MPDNTNQTKNTNNAREYKPNKTMPDMQYKQNTKQRQTIQTKQKKIKPNN